MANAIFHQTANTIAATTCAYGDLALLQRVCTYVYDTVVLPYMANTYATATTMTVITGSYQRATTTTTTTAHRNRHNSKSGKKQALGTSRSAKSTACHASVPTYIYDYDHAAPPCAVPTESTPTTTDSATVAYAETFANPPSTRPSGTPTAHSDVYYYGYRHLSTELGRWVSRDPIGERGDVNVYGFVGNGANSRLDSLGLYSLGTEPYPGYVDWTGKCGGFKHVIRWTVSPDDTEAEMPMISGMIAQKVTHVVEVWDCDGNLIMLDIDSFYEAWRVHGSWVISGRGGGDSWASARYETCTKGNAFIVGEAAYYDRPLDWDDWDISPPGHAAGGLPIADPTLDLGTPASNIVSRRLLYAWNCCDGDMDTIWSVQTF